MVKIASLVFNPFINDSRVLKEGLSLVKEGYSVEIVAHGDKELPSKDENNGLVVRRLAYLDRTITKGKIGKLKAYLQFIKESVAYCKDFDILHCNDINMLPIGVIIKKFYKKDIKIVYDAHEYETETYALSGIQKKATKLAEKFLIKYADKVITVSDSIANEYVKLYGIEKPALVLNAPSYKDVVKYDKFREAFNMEGKTIFLYQGGLGKNRGIEFLLEVFKTINNSESIMVFMGYGELESLIVENAKEHDNIFFHKAVSPDVLLEYTVSADFGIATIEDSCLSYRYCLPNKLFEYIMARIPTLCSNLPAMKEVIEKYGTGKYINYNAPQEEFARAISEILDNKAEYIKKCEQVARELSFERQDYQLSELIK